MRSNSERRRLYGTATGINLVSPEANREKDDAYNLRPPHISSITIKNLPDLVRVDEQTDAYHLIVSK